MTKKQINALLTIIDLNEGKTRALEKTDGAIFQCANNCMGVIYHEPIPEEDNWRRFLKQDDGKPAPYEVDDLPIRDMIVKEIREGDYRLVTGPFPGEVKPSKLNAWIRENAIPNPSSLTHTLAGKRSGKVLELTADGLDGTQYASLFNPRYVRLAAEAVGGQPRLYLSTSWKERPYQFLLVDSGPEILCPETNNIAIVLPVARYTEYQKLKKAEEKYHTIEVCEKSTGKIGVAETYGTVVRVYIGADNGTEDKTITPAEFNLDFEITDVISD